MITTYIKNDKTIVIFHTESLEDGTKYEIDNDFISAYNLDGTEPVFDSEKAKSIQLDKFRVARAPKLTELDVDFIRALETNDELKKAEIIAAKKALRDVTLISLPNDLESIKATWPDILN
jgi:hypothetical protein